MPIKPLAGITRSLRGVLIACVAISALAVVSDLYSYAQYAALPESAVFSDTYLASDGLYFIVALVQLALLVATGVVFLMWVYRANKNLRALSGVAMRFTPGWSVGWFFVPIMSLFRPYQVVRELWHVSHGAEAEGHAVVRWWWLLFILSGVMSSLAWQLTGVVQDTSDFLVATAAYAVADSVDVVGYAVTLVLVMRVAAAYRGRIDETAAVWGATAGYGGAAGAAGYAGVAGAAATAAALPPAAWHRDPAGRHQLRWWDGAEWTDFVADWGVSSEDPV